MARAPDPYTLALGAVTVLVHPRWSHTRTTFPDGAVVDAIPHKTAEYRFNAVQHGYPNTAAGWAHSSRDHEVLHTLVAQAAGVPHSPTLWAVAHGTDLAAGGPAGEAAGFEEALILAAQRWLRTGGAEVWPALRALYWLGVDLEALRARAMDLLYPKGLD